MPANPDAAPEAVEREVSVEVISGREGWSLYVENYRVVGPKPWGGGSVLKAWSVSSRHLNDALRASGYTIVPTSAADAAEAEALRAENARLREALTKVADYLDQDGTIPWGGVRYMDGSEIYADLRRHYKIARSALGGAS